MPASPPLATCTWHTKNETRSSAKCITNGTARLPDAAYAALPQPLQPLLGSATVATAAIAATLVATLVPFPLARVDEWYLLKGGTKTKRALGAARGRRSP